MKSHYAVITQCSTTIRIVTSLYHVRYNLKYIRNNITKFKKEFYRKLKMSKDVKYPHLGTSLVPMKCACLMRHEL